MSVSSYVSSVDFSPVRLSYAAALRTVRPRQTGTSFTYANFSCTNPDELICLAASNPEGQFLGLVATPAIAEAALNMASQRSVTNISFLSGSVGAVVTTSAATIPPLDYLFCDTTEGTLSPADRAALFTFASQNVKPSGLFVFRYQAYDDQMSLLRGLVSELSPEMSVDQAKTFLREIKNLNPSFFNNDPLLQQSLNDAIAHDVPDAFFNSLPQGETTLGSLDTLDTLLGFDFAYVCDAAIGANYLELSTPASAHSILMSSREQPFYEALKDFAMGRTIRNDIWCRLPVSFADTNAELFGSFAFGIMMPRESVPPAVAAFDRIIPLSSPLMTKIIDLMAMQPLSIGDFLAHDAGANEQPDSVLEAFQTLVATGIARPMRTGFICETQINAASPKWASSYNRYLDDTPITTSEVLLASSIVGNPICLSARDALVLQAISRAGLSESLNALMPELLRLSSDPDMAPVIFQGVDMTADGMRKMMSDVIEQQMTRWYAYGLLAA